MLRIKLDRCPYDDILFKNLNREVKEGLTVLTGCNGSGKSTFLRYVESKYEKNDAYKIFHWNGLTDKSIIRQKSLSNDIRFLATLATSSEGEEINMNLSVIAGEIGRFVKDNNRNIILLLDGADSGLSIDNIIEVKNFLKELLIPDVQKQGKEIYVIVSANSYEMAKGEVCTDVRTGKEMTFTDYTDYRRYILDTKKNKEKR